MIKFIKKAIKWYVNCCNTYVPSPSIPVIKK